ncbi:hypothetical protein BJ170DRAFT_683068 [Xylariales sp. AK1849]|nr:hypothetical protein BJ170DRAFT_683068 [Xylariales sp. AK1849]
MDPISSAASLIALVQAGGMLLKVGKAFHETFISKDHLRVEDSIARVASIQEFIQKIELFKAVRAISSPKATVTSHAHVGLRSSAEASQGSIPSGQGLDGILDICGMQLERLQKKVAKMAVAPDANKYKRFVGAIKQKLNEPEFAQIDTTITILLQQLTLCISVAQYELAIHGNDADHARHDEILQKHQEMEERLQQTTHQGLDQQTSALELLGKLMEGQMALGAQMSAFEQSHQWIVGSFAKLSLSPRLGRTFSGTTAADSVDPVDDEELVAPICPGLMKHPGYGFREDRLSNPMIAKSVLDRVDDWLSPLCHTSPLLCIQMTRHDDAVHDLCNRIVDEIASAGTKLLCYNGLPRDGSSPAPGWYTITHAIWWLTGQLLVPVPHIDGHMPSRGYIPNIEAIGERLEKQPNSTVFIVLYTPTRACPTEADRRLYDQLVGRLTDVSKSTKVRLLIFSDDAADSALRCLPSEAIVTYPLLAVESVALSTWEPKIEGNPDEDGSEGGTE